MADLRKLQDFAASHDFGLTTPLSHEQVERLAEYWMPRMFFHEQEKFHPISLDETISMVENLFVVLPPTSRDSQEEWRVGKLVRVSPIFGEFRDFNPPVVHVPDGVVLVPGLGQSRPAVRVLNDGSSTRDALGHPDVDEDAVITHGASFRRSSRFFGATQTLAGGAVASPGDPFVPRATGEDGQPLITVLASFKNLLDTLKYELQVQEAREAGEYPPDVLWGYLGIAVLLFPNYAALPSGELRQALLEMIAAHEAGEPISEELETLLRILQFDWRVWDAVTRFAFLEYDSFHAYNDFNRVQKTFFENEHEGDNEGCCLVFDRNVINLAAAGTSPDALLRAVPHCIITSVHEEFQNADRFRFIPPPVPRPDDPDRLPREDVDVDVYVAWGSHATYLEPGEHDLVDFDDVVGFVKENPSLLLTLLLVIVAAPKAALALAIFAAISEHFRDTVDKTSEDGIRTGPEDVIGDDPLSVAKRLIVVPMSTDEHVYQPRHEALLRLRAFPGKWGNHAEFINKSPRYEVKTGRYFRKLLRML